MQELLCFSLYWPGRRETQPTAQCCGCRCPVTLPGASKDSAILNKLKDFELSAEVHDFDLTAGAAESS